MTATLTMKDLPIDERPREKLLMAGPENLSNAELIAIILRTGSRERTANGLAEELLGRVGGLKGLNDASVEELMEIAGIGEVKAVQLVALTELTRRLHAARHTKSAVNSPHDLADLLMARMRFLAQECFMLVLLDNENQVIAVQEISRGSVNETLVHPREVFREAIRRNSTAVILAHNHPSGNPEPSLEDLKVTKRLYDSGELIGIEILDHLIIGDGKYVSLRERGII